MFPFVSPSAHGVPEVLLWATAAGLLLYVLLDGLSVEVVHGSRPHRDG